MTQANEKSGKSGKGFFASLKSALVEEVPDGQPKPVDEASNSAPVPRTASQPPAPPQTIQTKPAVDAAARQRLEAALEAAAPPGYVELQDTLVTLADSIPNENSRWKAAMKLAAKRGHTVEALLGDFDKCIGILEQKNREFDDETQSQLKRKVGGRKASIEGLDVTIKSKQDQIQQLQAEISQLSEQRGTESASMAADEHKIMSVKDGFDAAYQAVHSQLAERREKLAAFGKAV